MYVIMTDKDLNSYRFASGEEPSDEMLAQIMREVAEVARKESEEAHEWLWEALHRETAAAKLRYEQRIRQSSAD